MIEFWDTNQLDTFELPQENDKLEQPQQQF